MVHGGAGAGKSTVINILAMYTQKILKQEGDNPDQPYVIKTAFTGCAASNIQGQTLNATFGFSFDNKYRSLSDKMRDKRRTELQNLKLVIIDEVREGFKKNKKKFHFGVWTPSPLEVEKIKYFLWN